MRCRFLDRFGDLNKLPLLRFLYLDCDADAVKAAVRGSPEVALQPHEVYHLPLQPIGHYRRRHLDHLNDWLPREKLYALPRSLTPQGSRALGRLAFADNYLRLHARLRKEVQQATHPDALYQTVDRTSLALRDNVPRVYVIAGAGGGGSGFLVDLGYAVRRLLKQLRHNESPVTAFLLCGAPDDPATPHARTGQRLRHADRAEPLRRSGDSLHVAVRRRRPVHHRGGRDLRRRLRPDPGQPLARGAARHRRPPGQLPVPRADHAARPAPGPRAAAPRRRPRRRPSAASAPTASGSRAA